MDGATRSSLLRKRKDLGRSRRHTGACVPSAWSSRRITAEVGAVRAGLLASSGPQRTGLREIDTLQTTITPNTGEKVPMSATRLEGLGPTSHQVWLDWPSTCRPRPFEADLEHFLLHPR